MASGHSRLFCATCAFQGVQDATLARPCFFCHQLETPQPVVLVRNDCRGSISRTIYDRIKVQRPVSFLNCTVKNVSLPQLTSALGLAESADWQLTGQRRRGAVTFNDYMCTDWRAIGQLCSFHVPASRSGQGPVARARGNMFAYSSGSLGLVAPPLKVTHRTESYGGVQEERVKITFNLCIVTPIHAMQRMIGFSADYPSDVTVRKHWPVNTAYVDPKQYVWDRVIASFENGPPMSGLDGMLVQRMV